LKLFVKKAPAMTALKYLYQEDFISASMLLLAGLKNIFTLEDPIIQCIKDELHWILQEIKKLNQTISALENRLG
jgi:hypothetical protein